ncbi:hypothetical protein CP533_0753 [Ophiocordyceps camponoti-saundersi (nom. inval.)]|nr:hypothetical protein CP533_0753 [Ophiocordyceps camponoti-saundersi (nom. inval.)]
MDHSHMDHGGSHHHDDGMCSMNMLFTWDTTNLCIVFRQWHIRSTASLIFSLLAVVLLAMLYEALRALSRRFEAGQERRIAAMPRQNHYQASQRAQVIKSLFYALQNFYAFMLMLIFMTYNGWVMIAVSLGAFFGYFLFGQATSATKDNACH